MLRSRSREDACSAGSASCTAHTPELFSACALFTPCGLAPTVKLVNHDSQSDVCCRTSVSMSARKVSWPMGWCFSSHCTASARSMPRHMDQLERGTLCMRRSASVRNLSMAPATVCAWAGSASAKAASERSTGNLLQYMLPVWSSSGPSQPLSLWCARM